MSEAFGSVQEAQDSGALDKIGEFVTGLTGISTLLAPISTLLEPFEALGDIFSAEIEGSLANVLSNLFTNILSEDNIALIGKIATEFGEIFDKIFTEENIKLIGDFVSGFLEFMSLIIEGISNFQDLILAGPEAYAEEVAERQARSPTSFWTMW